MDWRQIAAIWLLSVLIGGLAITGIVLYLHRDKPAHRRPATWRPRTTATLVARWQQSMFLARQRMESATGLWQTMPAEDIARMDAARTAATAHAALQAGIPAADVATLVAADRAATAARLTAWYAEREERLTQALLDAGAASWRS